VRYAYERATLACSIYAPPAPSSGVVGAQALFLSGRTCTPLWPVQPPDQVTDLESFRDRLQTFIFAANAADWATLQTVNEGMTLRQGSNTYIIRHVEKWTQPFDEFLKRHSYLRLMVEKVKVDA
jgi:hypothetical protein